MSAFFDHLLAQAAGDDAPIQPRRLSLFERTAPAEFPRADDADFSTEVDETEPSSGARYAASAMPNAPAQTEARVAAEPGEPADPLTDDMMDIDTARPPLLRTRPSADVLPIPDTEQNRGQAAPEPQPPEPILPPLSAGWGFTETADEPSHTPPARRSQNLEARTTPSEGRVPGVEWSDRQYDFDADWDVIEDFFETPPLLTPDIPRSLPVTEADSDALSPNDDEWQTSQFASRRSAPVTRSARRTRNPAPQDEEQTLEYEAQAFHSRAVPEAARQLEPNPLPDADASEPQSIEVHISIGRIDVRAAPPPKPVAPAGSSTMTLEEYARRRARSRDW